MSRQNSKSGSAVRRNPELTAFLQLKREEAGRVAAKKRAETGAAPLPSGRGNHGVARSQEWLAKAIGLSARQYARIERGEVEAPEDIVGLICTVLGLEGADRVELYRLALNRDPVPDYLESARARLTPYWRSIVPSFHTRVRREDGHDVVGPIVYANSVSWDVLACNEGFKEMFPGGRPPANLFKWQALDGAPFMPGGGAAQLQQIVLAQLRGLLELYPGHRGLEELRVWCEETPGVREAWNSGQPPSFNMPDGGALDMVHAKYGRGTLELGILTTARPADRDLRFLFHHFHVGVTPEQLLAARGLDG